jgi:hypothetical protein
VAPGRALSAVGFIVSNMTRPAERVVGFYNQRGAAEQWIKEGKNAIKWTRLSCCSFAANAVRLQLHALAYNLANFMRDAGSAAGGQAVVADEPAGKSREDRRQGRAPWPLGHLPDGRGRGAEGIVPGSLAADRRTATKTGSSVGTEGVGCVITMKGVCLNDEEKHQIGFSGMVRAATNARSRADAALWLPCTPAEC